MMTGYIQENQVYLDVSLQTDSNSPLKQYRARVVRNYPYGIILSESQAKDLNLDLKYFSWRQNQDSEYVAFRTTRSMMLCSISLYDAASESICVEYKKHMFKVQIGKEVLPKEAKNKDNLIKGINEDNLGSEDITIEAHTNGVEEIIIGYMGLDRLGLTLKKVIETPMPIEGLYHPKTIAQCPTIIKGEVLGAPIFYNHFSTAQ